MSFELREKKRMSVRNARHEVRECNYTQSTTQKFKREKKIGIRTSLASNMILYIYFLFFNGNLRKEFFFVQWFCENFEFQELWENSNFSQGALQKFEIPFIIYTLTGSFFFLFFVLE